MANFGMDNKSCIFLAVLLLQICSQVNGASVQGITYSPYRQMGACPSPEQVDEDIRLIWSLTTRVRLYSTECRVVMEKLLTSGLQVLIGAWIDNAANDQKEVDDLVGLLREFPEANIYGIAIGNEPLLRQTMTPDQVANYLDDARYKIRQLGKETGSQTLQNVPIFGVDAFPHPRVVGASDVLAVNIHPFFQHELPNSQDPYTMAALALRGAKSVVNSYRSMFPGKRLVVTEIGWPTSSGGFEHHKGNMETTKAFMQMWKEYAAQEGIEYFWFELSDSRWKMAQGYFQHQPEYMSEFNFGLFDSYRQSKGM